MSEWRVRERESGGWASERVEGVLRTSSQVPPSHFLDRRDFDHKSLDPALIFIFTSSRRIPFSSIRNQGPGKDD